MVQQNLFKPNPLIIKIRFILDQVFGFPRLIIRFYVNKKTYKSAWFKQSLRLFRVRFRQVLSHDCKSNMDTEKTHFKIENS